MSASVVMAIDFSLVPVELLSLFDCLQMAVVRLRSIARKIVARAFSLGNGGGRLGRGMRQAAAIA